MGQCDRGALGFLRARGAEGVIIAQGGKFGGLSLYAKGGQAKFGYNAVEAVVGAAPFQGVGQGRQVQQFSNRGQSSRPSMGTQRAGGFQGAAAAGGARGGGRRR